MNAKYKPDLYDYILWLIFNVGLLSCSTYLVIRSFATNTVDRGTYTFLVLMLLLGTQLFYFNRYYARYWVDGGVLYRKGLFCGYKGRLDLAKIKEVGVQVENRTAHHKTYLLILYSASRGKRTSLFNSRSFLLPHNDDTVEFVKTFWDGEIPEQGGVF